MHQVVLTLLKYHIAPNFRSKKFRENVENQVCVNLRDKNFLIAPGEPMPTADHSNFCEKNFCDWMSNHEIHEDILAQRFGAIR